MMSLLLRARVLAPALAGLLLASCASVRREPYVVQEPGFLAPVEYQQKARVIAPGIYRDYNPYTFAIVGVDRVYTRTTVRPPDEELPDPPPTYRRTMQTIEVTMEQSKIPPGKCLRQCTGPCVCLPPRPRKAITFEFEPSGELIYTTHVTGPKRERYRHEEFAWWPSSRRMHGTVHAAKR